MEEVNKGLDLGYIISSSGTILPIRSLEINKTIARNGIKYKKGDKLYIHNEIIKYYIAMEYI